jgi:hypothetical protein
MKRALSISMTASAHLESSEDSDRFADKERATLFKRSLRAVRQILVPMDLTPGSLTTFRIAVNSSARLPTADLI